jgi:hypothetical protein
MDCSIVWVNKLQTNIATSTMEAEYNTFSMVMRDLIPLQHLCKAIVKGLGGDYIGVSINTNSCSQRQQWSS